MRNRPKRNRGMLLFGIFIGIVLAILLFLAASILSIGEQIAVIKIEGVITSTPDIFSLTTSPDDILSMIKKAEESPNVKGVLFEINSGGGSVVASREIAEGIKRMKKPKVCWLGDLAASGAYWAASACDKIVSDPLAITGSIGATASYVSFSNLFEKYGVRYEQITSGERKDIGSPFRNLSQEEREKLEYIVNETFRYMLEDIVENRNLNDEQISKIITADIFLGKDSVDLGLVDSLGSFQDAKEEIKKLSGAASPEFVEFEKKGMGLFDLLGML